MFSKKSTNAINVISIISMLGMLFGAFFLIIILSVYNGFEGLVVSLYNAFNPDIKVTVVEGKVFDATNDLVSDLYTIDGVEYVSECLEENAYFRYGADNEYIGTIKGVDENFVHTSSVDSFVAYGIYMLQNKGKEYCVIGSGVDMALNTNLSGNSAAMVSIYVPKRGTGSAITMDQAFHRGNVMPIGIFAIQQEFDNKYIIASLDFTRKLLRYENEVSSLEIKVKEGENVNSVMAKIQKQLGDEYKVQNRFQQNEVLFKIMQVEKWATFAIISFVLLIISFNIVGSLSMVVMEKSKDISILKAMGATDSLVRNVFLVQGSLMSIIGATIGLFLGTVVCLIQIYFKVVPLHGVNFVIDAYPVIINPMDYLLTIGIVVFISILASWIPARRAAKLGLRLHKG